MRSRFYLFHCLSGSAVAACLLAAGSAAAQSANAPENAQTPEANTADRNVAALPVKDSEIIVTGTLIRGKEPTGQEVNIVTSADISQLGAADPSQILASLPQDANFNSRPQVGGGGPYMTVNAPRLRYLGNGATSSNSTLLLLDGSRLPGMGVTQTSSDMDVLPIGAIERVEVATDGGSATYGADAVGGVVNVITRKKFDGLELGGHFGGAANFRQYDVEGTVGKSWSNASVWVSYEYAHHDLVYNNTRSYVRNLDYTVTPAVGNSLSCNPGNFTTSALVFTTTAPYYAFVNQVYPIANGAPVASANPQANRCDLSGGATFFPGQNRHAVMAGAYVDLSSSVTFDVKAYYTHRDSWNDGGVNYYSGVAADYNGMSGTVSGNFGPSLGYSMVSHTKMTAWGVVPRIKIKFGHDWQLMAFLNAAQGSSTFSGPVTGGDSTALADQVTNGSFNPFTGLFANTAAGQAAQAYQANYYTYSTGKDVITNARAVLDGPLLQLPGGDLRVALGTEYLSETFSARSGAAERSDFSSIPLNQAHRNVASVFGELSVPVFGANNRVPGIYSLTLSAAGRYDHYNDFGGTFNPKFGASYKPVSWWTIRGNWGRSFQAPSLAATAAAVPPAVVSIPAVAFGGNPAYPDTTGKTILLLYPGGGLNLKPQTASSWELGTDFRPKFIPGLSISATYYKIDFKNQIGFPAFFLSSFYTLYPNSYVMNTGSMTSAQISQYISSAYNASQMSQYVNNPSSVYALENGLNQNLSSTKTSGLDFSVAYEHKTGFGSLFASVGGTYILTYNTKATENSSYLGMDINSTIQLQTTASLGAKVGPALLKATWNRTGGYEVPATAGDAYQSRVSPFNVVNLAFEYAPTSGGVLKGTTLNLNIDNVFDQDPPVWNTQNGYSGFTLGRQFTLGLKKKF